MYSTYLGGAGEENAINAGFPGGIAVDAAGSAYVTGNTQSPDFPTTPGALDRSCGTDGQCNTSTDAFVTKFAPDGASLSYSTFLGGQSPDTGWGIAVDGAGRAHIAGDTNSRDFPTARAYQPQCFPGFAGCWDAFVTKLNARGSALVYSTYLGGDDREYIDRAFDLTVDAAGMAYVTGMTGSFNFPMVNPLRSYSGQVDAFVSRLGPRGALLYSTYLGAGNSDVGYGIAVDSAGRMHVSGLTISDGFPLARPLQDMLHHRHERSHRFPHRQGAPARAPRSVRRLHRKDPPIGGRPVLKERPCRRRNPGGVIFRIVYRRFG